MYTYISLVLGVGLYFVNAGLVKGSRVGNVSLTGYKLVCGGRSLV